MKLPDVPSPESLEKKYAGKLANKALNLMQGMLKMDPKERLSAIECLTHSYFDELRLNDPDFLKILNDENHPDLSTDDNPLLIT